MWSRLVNYGLFQAGWFACVLGAANGYAWLALPAVAVVVAVHLLAARRTSPEAGLLLICLVIGLLFESLLLRTGWVAYADSNPSSGIAPLWIAVMWMLFATTLNRSLGWLRGRPLLACLLGVIGGPLSYLAGESLGAMNMDQPIFAVMALAIGWGTLLPMMVSMAARMDGFAAPPMAEFVHADWRDRGFSNHA